MHNTFKSICLVTLMFGYILTLTSCEKEKDVLEFPDYFVTKSSASYNVYTDEVGQ